jgi:hypothetical protein
MTDRFRSFEEFWPYYVREHAKPLTRWFHFAGTATALGCLAAFVATRKARWIPAALVAGYGPAWFSHFFIEQNRPASFTYPAWSLQADLKMFEMMLTGRMDEEVERVLRAYAAGASMASDAVEAAPSAPDPSLN